jgi:hypothetical protein
MASIERCFNGIFIPKPPPAWEQFPGPMPNQFYCRLLPPDSHCIYLRLRHGNSQYSIHIATSSSTLFFFSFSRYPRWALCLMARLHPIPKSLTTPPASILTKHVLMAPGAWPFGNAFDHRLPGLSLLQKHEPSNPYKQLLVQFLQPSP